MKMQDIRSIAREMGIKTGNLKKVELVNAIQKAEGNEACYCTGKVSSCGQNECLWKDDCI